MATLPLLVKSAALGLAVAAPVGPMSLLCMRRTLSFGAGVGLATGFGIATGDGIYAALAAAGLAGVSDIVLAHARLMHAAAGVLLVYLGISAVRAGARRGAAEAAPKPVSAAAAFASAAALTLANPPTILIFAAILTALVPKGGLDAHAAAVTVAGVSAGSALWWCVVVGALRILHHTLGARARTAIDLAAGLGLAAFGLTELARAL
jgi:threonine/homoserine/homoserine lactone efflux protein